MSEQSRSIRQLTPAEPQWRSSLEEREIEIWHEATWDSITPEMMAAFEREDEQYDPDLYHAAPAGE